MKFSLNKQQLKYAILMASILVSVVMVKAVDVTFPTDLGIQFPGYYFNQGELQFKYGGNTFEGVIFTLDQHNLTTGATLDLGGSLKQCHKQLRGLYYNNARGLRVWPLDEITRSELASLDASYNNLSLQGGLFMGCDGDPEENVYGQLTHTLGNNTYKMVAGVTVDTGNNAYSGPYTGSFTFVNNKANGYLFDSVGGLAEITTPLVTAVQGIVSPVLDPNSLLYASTYYTKSQTITINIASNMEATYSIWGDLSPSISGYSQNDSRGINLTAGDGQKNIYATFSRSGTQDSSSTFVILDTTPPSAVELLTPSDESSLNSNVSISWSGGTDAGIGLDTYTYTIMSSTGRVHFTGTTANTYASISYTTFDLGDYTWKVAASDRLGNSVESSTRSFTIVTGSVEPPVVTDPEATPDSFSFTKKKKADLSRVYQSNIVIISGLGSGVYAEAELNRGVLFINGDFAGSTGAVKNGDVIWIEMISSSDYDDEVRATLEIGNRDADFEIQTKDEDDDDDDKDLSENSEAIVKSLRWKVWEAYQELVDAYEDKSYTRQRDVFLALHDIIQQRMISTKLKAKTATSNSKRVRYELQLTVLSYIYEFNYEYITKELDVDGHLLDIELDSEGYYEAPNGKEYKVLYDSSKGYYSSTMTTVKYFPTLEKLKAYIDANNYGSHTSASDRVIAPNEKRYNIMLNNEGKFTSLYFTNPVSFNTLNEMIRYISENNPYYGFDCNQRDSSITSSYHNTPNGKSYTIYVSTEGRYYTPNTTAKFCYEEMGDLIAVLNAWNE